MKSFFLKLIFSLSIISLITGCGGGNTTPTRNSGTLDTNISHSPIDEIPTDTTPPTLTLKGSPSLTLVIGDIYKEEGASALDNRDGDISDKVQTLGSVDTSKAGTYTITYTVTDAAGNKATPVKRTIIVSEAPDTTPPTLTLKGLSTLTLMLGDTYKEEGATASDTRDGDISDKVQTSGSVDTSKAGTYTITYTVTDAAGNKATPIKRTIIVSEAPDTTPPSLTLKGSPSLTLVIGDIYKEEGASALDNRDGDISDKVQTLGSVDTSKVGTYTITYTVTDAAGNKATPIKRTVKVKTNTKPVITLNGDNPLTITTIPLYNDIEPGATANDKEDGNITNNIKRVSTVKSQTAGTYTVTYSVTDSDNNTVKKERTVIIVAPNERPIIELKGANPFTLTVGDTFVDPGYIGRDKEDGDITSKIKVVSNTVNTSKAGQYEIRYTLTDSGGITVNALRNVTVQDQSANAKPVITLNGDKTVYLHLGENYNEAGYTVIDTEDGDISDKVQTSGSVDTSKAGIYTISYTVTDTAGNTASIKRIVVVQNNAAGTLTGTAKKVTLKHIGSGVGGAMFAIAFHPSNPNNIFFSGDMGLVYHTTNGGQSWDIIPGLYKVRFMQFDPKNPNIVWAGGGRGLFKSTDGGKHWQYTLKNFPTTYRPSLGTMTIDPTDSNILYIAEGYAPSLSISWIAGKVWKSVDGGQSWKAFERPHGPSDKDPIYHRNYTSMAIDPNSPYTAGKGHSTVYLSGRDGLYKSTDAGFSWKTITFYDEGQGADVIVVDKNGKSVLFASVVPAKGHSKGGVYRSDDGGAHWVAKNRGISEIIDNLKIRNKNIKNEAIHTLLLAHSPQNPNRLYVGSWQGIAKSDSLGDSWTQTTPREVGYIKHQDGNSYEMPSKRYISHFPHSFLGGIDNFIRLTAAPSNADIVAFADNQDVQFSTDGALTWSSKSFDYADRFIDTDIVLPEAPSDTPKNRYTHRTKSRGVQSTVNTDVAVDPFDSKILYATYMDTGLQISRDNGITWEHPSNGLPPRGHAWSVMVDPAVKDRLWVSIRERGAIYQSDDAGMSWHSVSIPDRSVGKVADLALDSSSNITSRTLYAATENKGIYKSTDGGKTWNNVLSKAATDIKADPSHPNILFAGTVDGLYKSTDKGTHWTQQTSASLGKIYHITISKNGTLYLIANLKGKRGYWDLRKLWRSDDGGATFKDVTPRFMTYIGAVAVNPNDANYLYISNFNTVQNKPSQKMVMARSKDGGITWEEIGKDFAFAMGSDIYIDPNNSKHILFNTRFSLIDATDTEAP